MVLLYHKTKKNPVRVIYSKTLIDTGFCEFQYANS